MVAKVRICATWSAISRPKIQNKILTLIDMQSPAAFFHRLTDTDLLTLVVVQVEVFQDTPVLDPVSGQCVTLLLSLVQPSLTVPLAKVFAWHPSIWQHHQQHHLLNWHNVQHRQWLYEQVHKHFFTSETKTAHDQIIHKHHMLFSDPKNTVQSIAVISSAKTIS